VFGVLVAEGVVGEAGDAALGVLDDGDLEQVVFGPGGWRPTNRWPTSTPLPIVAIRSTSSVSSATSARRAAIAFGSLTMPSAVAAKPPLTTSQTEKGSLRHQDEFSRDICGCAREPKRAFFGLLGWNSYGTEGAQPVAKVRPA
jgi:hypothetical protein